MFSVNVLNFLCLAATPLLVQAQQNQQTPLNEQPFDLVVPLTVGHLILGCRVWIDEYTAER
jgi:hypothetical protein